ncbi:hypothetical protein C5167_005552 [Papaver somniferum]|uniref:H15 domain-containing protein n=1 Tax=Papaver somniferum TaxID=3469 RepID=A0A4Y7JBP4_PAPSO|nr:hypothetical protein C5167_005552 [Papaver somniferum]
MDAQRKQMKEDIIKMLLSIHSSSLSPPNSSSELITRTKSSTRTEKLKMLIEDHLPSMFTANLIIPTHPPYAVMILEAIRNLRGKGKHTNEKSMSNYINTNFEGLPWAASKFLNHHLKELVNSGEISFVSTTSTYHLAEQDEVVQNPNPGSTRLSSTRDHNKEESCSSQQQKKRRRLRKKWKDSVKEEEPCSDMVLVSPPEDDDVFSLDENNETMAVKPLQKQMPEMNTPLKESVEEKHQSAVVEHPTAEKTLLVYPRKRKRSLMTSSSKMSESSTTTTVEGANGSETSTTHHNDRLTMTVPTPNGSADQNDVHIPKRRRISGKVKWMKFQQSQPQREFRPRRVPVLRM